MKIPNLKISTGETCTHLFSNNTGIGTKNTLYTFREIPKVENIMRLGRGWQKIGRHTSIDFYSGVHNIAGTLLDSLREITEESTQYSLQTK